MNSPEISVVLPVYNEEENLSELYRRLKTVLEEDLQVTYEIIFVDDGSKDNSWSIIKDLHEQSSNVEGVRFSRNFGQPVAISAGLKACIGKYVVVLDADLQNPPEEILKLLTEIDKGYDIVYGLRKHRRDPLFRRAGSQLLYWYATKFLHIRLPEGISAFRVMNRRVVDYFNELPERTRLFGALSSWLGFSYTCVDVKHSSRHSGKSKYSLFRLLRTSFDLVVAFSAVPLRWIGLAGILVALAGFVLAVYFVFKKLFFGIGVPGYTSIVVIIMFFSGIQLISLSIIGEYLSKMYSQVQGRPLFVVREALGPSMQEKLL